MYFDKNSNDDTIYEKINLRRDTSDQSASHSTDTVSKLDRAPQSIKKYLKSPNVRFQSSKIFYK